MRPRQDDPWGATAYARLDCTPLAPWQSWTPPHVRLATIRRLLSRCWYFSSTPAMFLLASWETLMVFVHRAGYPRVIVGKQSLDWAETWTPQSGIFALEDLGLRKRGVALALQRLDQTVFPPARKVWSANLYHHCPA